ncbi:MAG: DUF1385 domain-containing protein [Anaerolineaceae bacterium]|nr:DUF1385 domain-containing protein [Anaerolineaceae bacterium]
MSDNLKLPAYGGQALIEGVLMRGKNHMAASFRKPDGTIETVTETLSGIYQSAIRKIPFLRGLIMLWDSLVLGTKYLTISANMQAEEEDEKIEGTSLVLTLLISMTVFVVAFFLVPSAIGQGFEKWLGISSWWSNVIEGIIRLIFVIGYIWLVGKMDDIERVFMYHGAEHKTVNAFEGNKPLTVESVQKASIVHPRCGTSFLLTLVIISVLVFAFVGPQTVLVRLISRILLLPVIVGIAYEYIRFTSNHLDSKFVSWLMVPNLKLQSLTTRPPEDGMVEVAITAFNTMYELENGISEDSA